MPRSVKTQPAFEVIFQKLQKKMLTAAKKPLCNLT